VRLPDQGRRYSPRRSMMAASLEKVGWTPSPDSALVSVMKSGEP
jgi:hypothetical protein